MGAILGVTIPAYLAVLLGRALADRRFVSADFWPNIQRLSYFVFLPILIVHTLATANFTGLRVAGLIFTIVLTFAVGGVAVWLWRRWSGERPEMTIGFGEAALRANIPLGLAIAFALWGRPGLTMFVLAAIVYLPSVVIVGAYLADRAEADRRDTGFQSGSGSGSAAGEGALETSGSEPGGGNALGNPPTGSAAELSGGGGAQHDPGGGLSYGWEISLRRSLSVLVRNPLVIGAVIGIFLNITGIGLANGLGGIMQTLGFAAIPAGLLATGAQIDLDKAREAYREFRGEIRTALILKLIVMPVIALVIGAILGLSGITAATVVLLAALPNVTPRFTAHGGEDASRELLLPGITAASTIVAVVSLPLALWILT